jgi:threonine/homoserine/homoserine lactone efflux protein
MSGKPLTDVGAKSGNLRNLFIKGLLVHLTNPKAIFGWGAIFAIAVPPGSASGQVITTYVSLLTVSCTVFWGYGFLFSLGSFVRGYQKARRWFETAFGVLFGLAGLKSLTAKLS